MLEQNTEKQRLIIPEPEQEIKALSGVIIGQERAVGSFARLLAAVKSGIRPVRSQPLDVKLLAGPSGVGKTEMVYRFAEILGQDPSMRSKVIRIDGGKYCNESGVASLIGAPPSYIGFSTRPVLCQEALDEKKIVYTDKNGKERNVVVILFDEVEKADKALHHAFLSILDNGKLEMGNNTVSDFSNAVIFFTSNAGSRKTDEVRDAVQKDARAHCDVPSMFKDFLTDTLVAEEAEQAVLDSLEQTFPSELRGRIGEVVFFKNLDEQALSGILDLKIEDLTSQFAAAGVNIVLELDKSAKDYLIRHGYNPAEGARAMNKLIQRTIHDPLILAHSGVGISGKTIYIEREGEYGDLAFYFTADSLQTASGPDPSFAPEVSDQNFKPTSTLKPIREGNKKQDNSSDDIASLPPSVKSVLINEIMSGVKFYVQKRDELVNLGIINQRQANMDHRIREIAVNKLFEELKNGSRFYTAYRNSLVEAGIGTSEDFNNSPTVHAIAREKLKSELSIGHKYYVKLRDDYLNSGIGTQEEWDSLL